MHVTVNGEPHAVEPGTTLADLVGGTCRGTAAAVNSVVVPRSSYDATPLADGDRVEIVTAVQGG